MKTNTQLASNFELNRIKLGKDDIQLEVGDRFITNGAFFDFKPKPKGANQKFLRWRTWDRESSRSALKYKKDVLRADNIELVLERSIGDNPKNKDWKEYEVKYVYQQPAIADSLENVLCLWINEDFHHKITYQTKELKVERETKEMIFLGEDQPITYYKKIAKKDFNRVINPDRLSLTARLSSRLLIMCRIDDIHEAQDKLFVAYDKLLHDRYQIALNEATAATNKINEFKSLKEAQGL